MDHITPPPSTPTVVHFLCNLISFLSLTSHSSLTCLLSHLQIIKEVSAAGPQADWALGMEKSSPEIHTFTPFYFQVFAAISFSQSLDQSSCLKLHLSTRALIPPYKNYSELLISFLHSTYHFLTKAIDFFIDYVHLLSLSTKM